MIINRHIREDSIITFDNFGIPGTNYDIQIFPGSSYKFGDDEETSNSDSLILTVTKVAPITGYIRLRPTTVI